MKSSKAFGLETAKRLQRNGDRVALARMRSDRTSAGLRRRPRLREYGSDRGCYSPCANEGVNRCFQSSRLCWAHSSRPMLRRVIHQLCGRKLCSGVVPPEIVSLTNPALRALKSKGLPA